jgi:nicotinamidase-related amidase
MPSEERQVPTVIRPLKLDPARAVVVVVDVQERLSAAMPSADLARLVKYVQALLGAARELGLPVLATEQYPKGIGPTLPALRELLSSPPLQKMAFSCGADPGFRAALEATLRRQVVLAGMETHVCVFQTARDLVAQGYEVQVCADAVVSRTEEHRRVGLELCREAGAVVTTAETAIFDLLGLAGTPQFKKVAPLVK